MAKAVKVVVREGGDIVKLTRDGEKTVTLVALVNAIQTAKQHKQLFCRDGVYVAVGSAEALVFDQAVLDIARAAKAKIEVLRVERKAQPRVRVVAVMATKRVSEKAVENTVASYIRRNAAAAKVAVAQVAAVVVEAAAVVEAAPAKPKRTTRVRKAAQAARAALA